MLLLTLRQKRKRREYRLARKAAFARPEPGFSLYEGRTRGKRMRYTFSDEELDIDSDALSVRRSTRHSGRETSAAPTGPTITASGRQVRSRATGMYGESLLSGQTTDRASPATGDYIRSDASEEPQRPTHNRSTRASNNVVNGWPKGRKHIETYNSLDEMDDEDDATSWDGGDEEDDEPDHMDLDDDEDDFGAEPSDEDDEPKSLVVRLKYRKDSFNPPVPAHKTQEEGSKPGGAAPQVDAPIGPPPTGMETAQPALAPAPAPLQPAQTVDLRPQPDSHIAPSSAQIQQGKFPLPTMAALAPAPPPTEDSNTLPKLDSLFRAPTPPYTSQEEPKPQPQSQYPVSNTEPAHASQPFLAPLQAPTPAPSWQ